MQQNVSNNKFCHSLTAYKRRETSTVKIGDLLLGSNYPIRVQSMTTTDTMDTIASVAQIKRMVDAGCELVRLTAPSIKEAKNLEYIKKMLQAHHIFVPLVADIHFTPNAAEVAARIVEKVRVNPGNYADKKKFDFIEYTDAEYANELDRIREKFVPLVRICKEYGTAMRIGTNHGSLSDRIMSRYGDSPLGMVESAMEFLRICEEENYYNIVLSMKSSNTQVMVQAYRLLVQTMNSAGMKYPLHLGVTEAGDGDDGRIKSALGIGSLLQDGIGDTIRVSLTEDPEFEIPVAKQIIAPYSNNLQHNLIAYEQTPPKYWSAFAYNKRPTDTCLTIGQNNVPRVIADLSFLANIIPQQLSAVGHAYDEKLDKWHMSDLGCDFIYLGNNTIDFMLPNGVKAIYNAPIWNNQADKENSFPLFVNSNFLQTNVFSRTLNFLQINTNELTEELLQKIASTPQLVLVLNSIHANAAADLRNSMFLITNKGLQNPVIINHQSNTQAEELFLLETSSQIGSLLTDGLGDGVLISNANIKLERINQIAFGILQAARARTSKTEYISCPSCGRTLFDLQETTAMIRQQTDHLKGIKIAIMGCIVNGPGEMADADYGYVGSGVGKITLYRGKEVVKKGVEKETAVAELINIIKSDGNWVEKVVDRI